MLDNAGLHLVPGENLTESMIAAKKIMGPAKRSGRHPKANLKRTFEQKLAPPVLESSSSKQGVVREQNFHITFSTGTSFTLLIVATLAAFYLRCGNIKIWTV
jgi:hypothetical protein